jgi:acetylornithine deacetylase/succinyl-diaminopimelate desuccinylase-like protein
LPHTTTLDLARQLIGRQSIAPDDGGCLELIASRLAKSGFSFERMDRGKPPVRVGNLWARHGTEPPLVCLAGHVDVAPVLPASHWSSDPFAPVEREGRLIGRGAADMKTSIAAMVTAAERFVAAAPSHPGSIAIALTSNEQAVKPEGTLAIAQQLQWRGDAIDACILGKPTSRHVLGDTIVNGRSGWLKGLLTRAPLDVRLDVHFRTASAVDDVQARVRDLLVRQGIQDEVRWTRVREPYACERGRLVDVLASVVAAVTGLTPAVSGSETPSDGSVLATIAREVVEFGPVGASVDEGEESVPLADIERLSRIYEQAIAALLA